MLKFVNEIDTIVWQKIENLALRTLSVDPQKIHFKLFCPNVHYGFVPHELCRPENVGYPWCCARSQSTPPFSGLFDFNTEYSQKGFTGCPSRPWKDSGSNCYCGNVRKMLSLSINAGCRENENCSTRNVRKIFRYKRKLLATLSLHESCKTTQSSAVVCLNKEFSLRVHVKY